MNIQLPTKNGSRTSCTVQQYEKNTVNWLQ